MSARVRSATRGTFVERADDRHVALRSSLLDGRVLPAPDLAPEAVARKDGIDGIEAVLRRQLDRHGLGLVTLEDPLVGPALLALGDRLGDVMPETDPAVRPNVESGKILHLVSAEGNTADVSRQPFATGPLSLHSEGSGRPTREQPRYVVLMCRHPGDDENAAQTVLVPFTSVDDRLRAGDREILGHLRYDRPGVPTIRRVMDGRAVYSFRDFQAGALDWVCDTGRYVPEDVPAALAALLTAMYDEGAARALRWRRGLLAVIDNTWVFHGRSAAPFRGSTRHRHLQRLRITA
ncbi:hypothetical protein GCM10022225_07540 [Plantactinospora mayteni]|uniref:TauD/TfdA-like domain-containing protein n=1 Tax=Plantactinospora mayteni TaxID=566021 RepID=A0ABQ4EIG1_9ACTN|nr:TauD/TfdA family dioxygenase [Plantactinospora mayteni]GIG94500.1 hypothetical protein Pma05_10730 [Plantactinospora mayteni]